MSPLTFGDIMRGDFFTFTSDEDEQGIYVKVGSEKAINVELCCWIYPMQTDEVSLGEALGRLENMCF